MKPFLTKKGREAIVKLIQRSHRQSLMSCTYHNPPPKKPKTIYSRLGGFIRPADRTYHSLKLCDANGELLPAEFEMCGEYDYRGLPVDTFVTLEELKIPLKEVLADAEAELQYVEEVCPHCDAVYTYCVDRYGYEVHCSNCHEVIMLCSKCLEDTDGEVQCDWHEKIEYGYSYGICRRGTTRHRL